MKFIFSVLVAALLAACDSGDDSKINVPLPEVGAPDESYSCAFCQVNGGCPDASLCHVTTCPEAGADTRTFCQNIGACTGTGSCAVDGGHK